MGLLRRHLHPYLAGAGRYVIQRFQRRTAPLYSVFGAGVNLAVTGATNASPIEITTASAHGFSNGDTVYIQGVLGNTAANGIWTISSASGSTFTLDGSTGNGTYTSGGRAIRGLYKVGGWHPTYAWDPGNWYDFFDSGVFPESQLSLGTFSPGVPMTQRQYEPGTYAIRLDRPDLFVGKFAINTRSGASQFFLDQTGTLSVGLWGCLPSDSGAKVTVVVKGLNFWTLLPQQETITVEARNGAASGSNATHPDLMSPWKVNAGTALAPQPRGWLGRWGTAHSRFAWASVQEVNFKSVTVSITGWIHGFDKHPMEHNGGSNLTYVNLGAPFNWTPDPLRYYPELFLHAHEASFRSPWAGASMRQLRGIRLIRGEAGMPMIQDAGEEGYPLVPGTSYLIFAKGFARGDSERGLNELFDPPGPNLGARNIWFGSPDNVGEAVRGDVWGFQNADDVIQGSFGDGPYHDVGTMVEAWWDPDMPA